MPGQEAIMVYLQKTLLLSLNDLLAVRASFLYPRGWIGACARRACHGTRAHIQELQRSTVRWIATFVYCSTKPG